MASGESNNTLIQNSSGEFKEFLSEAYHLGLQDESVNNDNFPFIQSNIIKNLYDLPARIRIKVWSYLDFLDLVNVGQTCSKFRQEVLPLYEAKASTSFQSFMNILPFIPLHRYLDVQARNTMRLVCKHLKTIMDFYDDIDRRRGCRWGTTAYNAPLGYSDLDNLNLSFSVNMSELTQSEECTKTTIFDLQIQDLKRVFSKLDEDDLKSVQNVCEIFNRIVQELNEHPFEEYRENFAQLNLMDLPFEIHERIINFCTASDRPKLRLVSKLMQFQVDTLAGVEVHLNDLKWGWDITVGKLPPAYSLIITNVENVNTMRYFTNEDNCMLLTRVVLDGKFPATAFLHLLDRCKNLRYLGFTHALLMSSIGEELRKSFPVKRTPLELPSMRALNLKIEEVDWPSNNIFRVHSWTWTNAFELMKPSIFHMPRLTSFSLCENSIITHNLMHEVAGKVLNFILEHRHTLKYISIILNGNCIRSCNCPPFQYQMNEDNLKELKLAKFSHDCDWRISRPFTCILSAQTSLKELSCFKLSDWEFYAGVILNNRLSLRSVKIEKNLAPVIDLNVFSSCLNLEHLWISQYGSSTIGQHSCNYLRTIRTDQRLTNLHTLPISIKSLHILDQTVEAAQIKAIPERLKNLEILDLQFLGSWNGKSFGMSTEIVSEILQLRKLNCLLLEEIRTLDACLADSFENALSEINLIPFGCSQIIKCFGCAVYGILVAKKLPNSGFMPDWEQRVSCYFDHDEDACTENYFNFNYHLIADSDEGEGEEDEEEVDEENDDDEEQGY